MFWYAYPGHWAGHGRQLTLPVVAVYFFGLVTTFWCLFSAVVNFKTRNDPGGTVTMEVTRQGETKVVEVESSSAGFGGVGVFGREPDGDAAASDGGATGDELASPIDPESQRTPVTEAEPTDRYCGNCTHFEYVRTDDGITPYCERHAERMTDMDACERWEPNR
jgi:hypothetical protein